MVTALPTPKSTLIALGTVGAARMLSLVIGFACTILTVRILISAVGEAAYGAVILVATLTALIPFADLGIGIAITNLTVDSREGTHAGLLLKGYSSAIWILCGVGLTVIVISGCVSGARLWPTLIGKPILLLGDPNLFMPGFAALFALWLLTGPAYRVLVGLERSAYVALLQGVAPVISVLLYLSILALGWPLFVLAYVPLISSLLTALFAIVSVSRAAHWRPGSLFAPWRIGKSTYSSMLRTGAAGLGIAAGVTVILQSDRVLISHQSSTEQLAFYAVTIPLFFAIQSLLGAIGSYLWPYYRRRGLQRALSPKLFALHTILMAGVGLVMALGLIVGSPIYFYVVGYTPDKPWPLITMIGIFVLVQCCTLPGTSLLMSPEHIRTQGFLLVGCAAIKVALAWHLIPAFGAAGAVAGSIIAVGILQLPLTILLAMRSIKQKMPD